MRVEPDELFESKSVSCPYCGQTVELVVEADLEGEMVVDCEVCCRPWHVRIVRRSGDVEIRVDDLDA